MAGKRKRPKLREKDGCFVTDIYKPDGKRTTISFGAVGERSEGEIYAAFGQWLDLFNQHPHKVLASNSPYDVIANIINPRGIVSVGQLHDKYVEWMDGQTELMRDGRESPDIGRARRIGAFLLPYGDWPVSDFGPDELTVVQQSLVDYRYFRAGHGDEPVPYIRTSINDLINVVHKIWQWGVGREITTEAQARRLKEVRPLRVGKTQAHRSWFLILECSLSYPPRNLTYKTIFALSLGVRCSQESQNWFPFQCELSIPPAHLLATVTNKSILVVYEVVANRKVIKVCVVGPSRVEDNELGF
jgi:hypothetical protein